MPEKIRFHLDENVSFNIARGLRRRGLDVTTYHESDLVQTTDLVQLNFAHTQNRVLVTHDSDFLKLHEQGIPHSRIAFCCQATRSIGQIIKSLLLIYELLNPEEMNGNVEFL